MINWILQKNITNQNTLDRIKNVLNEQQVSFEEITVIPFSKEFPEIKNIEKYPIIYGSTTMMINAYKNPIIKRGVFFDPEKFNMANYVQNWGDSMLNADGKLIQFKEVKKLQNNDHEFFIRPNSDEKEFAGKIFKTNELIDWYRTIESLNIEQINPQTKIWIAKPKMILKEWRIFIVDKRIVSVSKYMENQQINIDNQDIPSSLINFTTDRILEYQPNDIFVMDIALTKNSYKIIECNCFNGTGFYNHDIEKIVKLINKKIRGLVPNIAPSGNGLK